MPLWWNIALSALLGLFALALAARVLRDAGAPVPRPFAPKGVAASPEAATPPARELAWVFLGALLFRGLLLLAGMLGRGVFAGEGGGPIGPLIQWDATNYLRLAELGYADFTENGEHLFVVFFPLYVWLIRLFRLFIGDSALSAVAVSWLSYAGGCCYLYRLGAMEWGRGAAKKAVIYISLFPFGFFLGGIMPESLFFFTAAAALYYIRRRRYGRYALFGILASLCRMHGLLLVLAAAAELLEDDKPFARRGTDFWRGLGRLIPRALWLLTPALGTGLYLLVNWYAAGDPFAFISQQAHWSQGANWLPDTLWYLCQNVLGGREPREVAAIWLPEVLLFLLFAALLCQALCRQPGALVVFSFFYLFLSYSLSWLLSAGRYLCCAVPFFLFAGCLGEKHPLLHGGATAACAFFLGIFYTSYLTGGIIM